jgi:hypothetical protein
MFSKGQHDTNELLDVSTPMERLAMYECAVAQVFALCSLSSMGYDGLQHFPGPDGDIVRVRLYWYTFVHEGITSGLKGGRLVLDEDDLDTFNATLPQGWALVRTNFLSIRYVLV